jgi:hypothetical protein
LKNYSTPERKTQPAILYSSFLNRILPSVQKMGWKSPVKNLSVYRYFTPESGRMQPENRVVRFYKTLSEKYSA